jgi:hypothetical protein
LTLVPHLQRRAREKKIIGDGKKKRSVFNTNSRSLLAQTNLGPLHVTMTREAEEAYLAVGISKFGTEAKILYDNDACCTDNDNWSIEHLR